MPRLDIGARTGHPVREVDDLRRENEALRRGHPAATPAATLGDVAIRLFSRAPVTAWAVRWV
jgi:hypothetical protein